MIDCSRSENPDSKKVAQALRDAAVRLGTAGVDDPLRDARVLMRWALGLSGAELAAAPDRPMTSDEARRFDAGVADRAARRPISHIVGGRAFYGRWFRVDDTVLDPRPESETLVEQALISRDAAARFRVLDLGVGSGALLLSVLAERPLATGLGVDASKAALLVAEANAVALGLADRAAFHQGDWVDEVAERFDLILCNPPYIPEGDLASLSPEVRLYEPHSALSPGPDGLTAYRRLAGSIDAVLADGGVALFEIGEGQAHDVVGLFATAGFSTDRHRDLDGRVRVVSVRRADA